MSSAAAVETWLRVERRGLYCRPADLYIDPSAAVTRAVVTHGHADHARPGHGSVLATPETLAIMRARFGAQPFGQGQPLAYGQVQEIGGVRLWLVPAGHVLGSAQVVLEWRGRRVVVSGDYKRRPDPTCAPFEPVTCDLFITEATFGLPVFRHPDDRGEIAKLLQARRVFPERAILVGAYALGKAQRLIGLLRQAGYDRPIYLHGALQPLSALYRELGIDLGPLEPATGRNKDALKGEIVLAPPGALADRWSRRLPEPLTAIASGWMGVRQRARQRGVELPLVISDHADWDELTGTMSEVQAEEIWVTHGNEEALVHHAGVQGQKARALSLVGRGEAEQEAEVESRPGGS